MKPAPFEYFRPESVPAALAALAQGGWGARVLAGGQSLLPMLNLRLAAATQLIDVSRLDELRRVLQTDAAVVIGACVRHAEIEDGLVPDPGNGLMRYVARRLAYRAVRNRGTIGGSVSLADPSADWLTVLVALDATLRIAGPDGGREVRAADSITGAYASGVDSRELLTAIAVPRLASEGRWGFSKVVRKAGEYPVTTATVIRAPAFGARIVIGGMDRAPLVLPLAARELAASSKWDAAVEARLRSAIRKDLAEADRGEDVYQATLAETTAIRATAMAMGA